MFEEKSHQNLDKTSLILKMDFYAVAAHQHSPKKNPYNLIKNLQKDNLFNYCLANLSGMEQN